ncbi:6963_t:CDS:2 [Diversispora eburnea]|uniref:6963_t:CDS:1 n=1 Tax=Diversispora eburnea TaxID=1213867 RepID=A0A9N8V385_9GLOM|nr:6963_t:CDS:2 [Diversispora eburnea]
MSISPKSIIVTGASRGLGRATTLQLLKYFNSNVIAVARSGKDLKDLKLYVEKDLGLKGKLEIIEGDITEDKVVNQVVQKSLDTWGSLDGIIANAGVLGPGKIADTNVDWKRGFDVNFFSVITLFQKAIPHLRNSKGRIITVSSGGAFHTYDGWGLYCTSKAGLLMLTNCIASEEPDIIALSILPGVIDTKMQQDVREKGSQFMRPDEHKKFVELYEKKKLVNPELPGYVMAALVSGGATKEMSGKFYDYNDEKLADFQKK